MAATNNGPLLVARANDGEVLWQRDLGAPLHSAPALAGDRVYVSLNDGRIIALSLQPQQLRLGRMVARAGDADRPGGGAEIAYVTGETIVVERFSGRLPSGLAASM